MENINRRVLAYQLAKEIKKEELSEVSGGGLLPMKMCLKTSGGGAATNGQWEAHLDLKLDA